MKKKNFLNGKKNFLNGKKNFPYGRKKYINSEQVRLYNASLNKLIPKQLKQFNFEY